VRRAPRLPGPRRSSPGGLCPLPGSRPAVRQHAPGFKMRPAVRLTVLAAVLTSCAGPPGYPGRVGRLPAASVRCPAVVLRSGSTLRASRCGLQSVRQCWRPTSLSALVILVLTAGWCLLKHI